MTRKNAPGDFVLPAALEKLEADGCTTVQWRGRPVAVLCLERSGQGNQDLFVFVVDRAVCPGFPKPGGGQTFGQAGNYLTAGWSRDDKGYLLAGTGDIGPLQPYFAAPESRN